MIKLSIIVSLEITARPDDGSEHVYLRVALFAIATLCVYHLDARKLYFKFDELSVSTEWLRRTRTYQIGCTLYSNLEHLTS